MTRSAVAPESEAPARQADGERDASPLPGTVGRTTRISMLAEAVNVPPPWLDRLLAVGHELPFDQGEAAVLAALATAVERIVPEVRVGLRLLPRAGTGEQRTTSMERRASWTEPPKSNERARSVRMFPDAAHERSVTLPGVGAGAVHFASEEDVLSSEQCPQVQLMDRVAMVAAQALARVRAEDRAAALQIEVRTVEGQMVQAEKLASLGQIAAGMVHELNNPLTSIAAYTDFLLRRAAKNGADEDDVERLRRIAESANRMLRFTRDLVSYARPSGDVPIAVEMNVVIDRALAFCEHEIADASVVVERSFDAEIGIVRGLPEQLAQVFVNLVTNACHAMALDPERRDAIHPARSPVLRISTARTRDGEERRRVKVIVQDSGCGISTENLALIFNPFFTTKAAGRGTGLGLSIVKTIVDSHRGDIRAESDTSIGTRFVLTFPIE